MIDKKGNEKNSSLMKLAADDNDRRRWFCRQDTMKRLLNEMNKRTIILTVSHLFTSVIMACFCSLPDLVLLEIFSYLSCEDALFAFAELNINRLIDLLVEHGAFRHICVSSALSRQRYLVLKARIWRLDSVRSLVVEDIFAGIVFEYTSSDRYFPSLVELRLLRLRRIVKSITQFVIAHASTLTHLTVTSPDQPYSEKEEHSAFFHEILPHLSRLTTLNACWRSEVQVLFVAHL
jgi:hypothetical protein